MLSSYRSIYKRVFAGDEALKWCLSKEMIRLSADNKNVSILTLLNITAAFDTVDHMIPLDRLENRQTDLSNLGTGPPLNRFNTYLICKRYFVNLSNHEMHFSGIPQGLILCPLLFCLYMLPHGKSIGNQVEIYCIVSQYCQITLMHLIPF